MYKVFRHNIGAYYDDGMQGAVIVWHKCSNKPMYISAEQFYATIDDCVCPKCGDTLLYWKKMKQDEDPFDDDGELIEDDSVVLPTYLLFNYTDRIEVISNGTYVIIKIYNYEYTLKSEAEYFTKSSSYMRYTVNVKTGNSYDHNKYVSSARCRPQNISLSGTGSSLGTDVMDAVHNEISKGIKRNRGENIPEFESYGVELNLHNLIMYNRCPFLNPEIFSRIANSGARFEYGFYRFYPPLKELQVKYTCCEPIQTMLSKSKIPKVKSLLRIAYRTPEGIPLLASISRTFKNIDLIRTLYYTYRDCSFYDGGACVDFSADIFHTMLRYKSEQIIANKLILFRNRDSDNNAYITLSDIIRNYEILAHCDFDFAGNYSIGDLHMYLSTAVTSRYIENKEITYTSKELSRAISDSIYTITPVETTHQLIDIGKRMGICVGSYSEAAIKKKCTIYALNKVGESKPRGCIEIRENTVIQAKGSYNQLLNGHDLNFVKNWIADKGLSVGTKDLQGRTDCHTAV